MKLSLMLNSQYILTYMCQALISILLLPAPRTRARAWCCRCRLSALTGSMRTLPPSSEGGRWAGAEHSGTHLRGIWACTGQFVQ